MNKEVVRALSAFTPRKFVVYLSKAACDGQTKCSHTWPWMCWDSLTMTDVGLTPNSYMLVIV